MVLEKNDAVELKKMSICTILYMENIFPFSELKHRPSFRKKYYWKFSDNHAIKGYPIRGKG